VGGEHAPTADEVIAAWQACWHARADAALA
jgi:hypothetical protein